MNHTRLNIPRNILPLLPSCLSRMLEVDRKWRFSSLCKQQSKFSPSLVYSSIVFPPCSASKKVEKQSEEVTKNGRQTIKTRKTMRNRNRTPKEQRTKGRSHLPVGATHITSITHHITSVAHQSRGGTISMKGHPTVLSTTNGGLAWPSIVRVRWTHTVATPCSPLDGHKAKNEP